MEDLGALRYWFYGKLRAVCHNIRTKKEESSCGVAAEVQDYIRRHYADDLSLDDVSYRVNISPYYFSKLFKNETGMTYDYSGALSGALTADGAEKSSDGESVGADTADENAALAENGGALTITNGTLSKSGDDTDGDNCNFYGINSILLAVGESSSAKISDSTLTASSQGSNGIFATDSATVYASGDTISTTADNSRGLDATYGGTIVANDMMQ